MLNNFKVLLGLLIVIAGFAYYVTQSGNNQSGLPKYLIPEWQDNNDEIAGISHVKLSKAGETIDVKKVDETWYINDGFFANLSPLSELFQSLKNAEILEAKTKNPDNHGQLDLGDDGLKVTLFIGNDLFKDIHIGKRTSSGVVFVRNADEDQTYVVKNLAPPTFNENSWLLTTVVDFPANDVVSITFEPVEGDSFTIERDNENLSLQLVDMPESHQLKDVSELNNIAAGLTRLMIDEAIPIDLTDKTLKSTNTYKLADGSTVVLKLFEQGEDYYITLSGDKLSRFEPWMMKIASYKFTALNKKLSDMIEPITEVNAGESVEVDGSIE
jgi:hypothetical protein